MAPRGDSLAAIAGLNKFNGTDYEVWSVCMESVLIARKIAYVIQEDKKESTDESSLNKKWKSDDEEARSLLLLSLEPDVVRMVAACTTAKDIWDRLKTVHSQTSERFKLQVLQDFYNLKMEPGMKVSTYIANLEIIVKRMKDIGMTKDDEEISCKLVTGLGPGYKNFKSNWMSTPVSERSIKQLLPRLLAEENLNNQDVPEAVAMKATVTRNHNDKKKELKEIECFYCNKRGHMKRDCRKLKRDQTNDKETKSKGREIKKPNENKYAVVARHNFGDRDSWYFDSGASLHMSSRREWFSKYENLTDHVPIQVGNKEFVYAVGKGDIEALSFVDGERIPIRIEDVYYVPGISDNLYSQGVADEKGLTLTSKKGKLYLATNGKRVIEGSKESGNMYRLNIEVPIRANIARTDRTLEEWHRVLGHPDINEIKNMAKKGCAEGFNIVGTSVDQERCGDCAHGKGHKASHPVSNRERATKVLERVHTDLVGPITPPTLGGGRYFMLIRDENSSFMHVYFIADKTQVVHAIRKYIIDTNVRTQRRVQIIRSDNGSEFKNAAVTQLCATEGILQEFCAPHTAQQNGEIERANETVLGTARTMLLETSLPIYLWGEAVLAAVYTRNRITNKRNRDKTPYELFYGRPPLYGHMIEFGRELQVIDHSRGQRKFSSRTLDAHMVGYTDRTNTYRCYIPAKDEVIITSDVILAPHQKPSQTRVLAGEREQRISILFESSNSTSENNGQNSDHVAKPSQEHTESPGINPPETNKDPDRENCISAPTSDNTSEGYMHSAGETSMAPMTNTEKSVLQSERQEQRLLTNDQISMQRQQTTASATCGNQWEKSGPAQTYEASVSHIPRAVSRVVAPGQASTREQMQTASSDNYEVAAARSALPVGQAGVAARNKGYTKAHSQHSFDWILKDRDKRNVASKYARIAKVQAEPQTYEQAMASPDRDKWEKAMNSELESLNDNQTWVEVPKHDQKEITVKWVYKIKRDSEGNIQRYKARLVARGFSQVSGIDYDQVFSPVVRMESIRGLFSVAAQYGLEFAQIDVETAFLNGEVTEELYIKPPDGIHIKEGTTLRLLKSLYGLKQAPRCWHSKFTEMLKLFNMQQTQADPCVFVNKGKESLYLALYVDDGIIFAKDRQSINDLVAYLTKYFKVKIVNSNCFLGIEIICDRSTQSIFLYQQGYAKRVLERYGMSECKPAATPLEAGHELNKAHILEQEVVTDVPYAEAIGSLQYLASGTRPDLSFALSILSKYTRCPRPAHWQAVKRALRYLKGTINFGLHYRATENPKLDVYCDADYAGDHENRRSTSGIVSFINTAPITYKAKQQNRTSLSTTESEYIASTQAVKDIIWLRRFLHELGIPVNHRADLWCDNQSAIRLIKNPEFHERTKHIDVRHHFIREEYQSGVFSINYISTEKQRADIFTKALTAHRHNLLRQEMYCVDRDDIHQGGC